MAGGWGVIILDTCALLWLVGTPEKLSQRARRAVSTMPLAVVAISAWEIALKTQSNKLHLPDGMVPTEFMAMALADFNIRELHMDAATFCAAAALPPIHRDPCDRMIVASAQRHRLPIVTADAIMPRYPAITVLW
jgi:PIN domain nuclease of toxin-antitoxin system